MEVVDRQVLTRAAVGAALIGVGLSLMLSASRKLNCEECEEKNDLLPGQVDLVSDIVNADDD